MQVKVAGILSNQFGQILMVTAPEQPDWQLPSGNLPASTLIDEAIVDVFDTQTTLKTLAIRLVGLYFLEDEDCLVFVFRCGKRGGEAAATERTGNVGFIKRTEMPKNVAKQHKVWLMDGFVHNDIAPKVVVQSAVSSPLSFLSNLFKPNSAKSGAQFDVTYAVVEEGGKDEGRLSAVIQTDTSLQLIFSGTAPTLVTQAKLQQTPAPDIHLSQGSPTQFQQL